MGRVNGQEWLARHVRDPYVKKAQALGYRSRASFKLLELQKRDKLFKPGMTIIDLGAAPGGWSQVISQLNLNNHIIALDLLPMDPISGVTFIQGDFQSPEIIQELEGLIFARKKKVDWIISDMAPNLTGRPAVDQPIAVQLAEEVLDFAKSCLALDGGILIKLFQGVGFDAYVALLRQAFQKVAVRKPESSRPYSREVYILARGFKEDSPVTLY